MLIIPHNHILPYYNKFARNCNAYIISFDQKQQYSSFITQIFFYPLVIYILIISTETFNFKYTRFYDYDHFLHSIVFNQFTHRS